MNTHSSGYYSIDEEYTIIGFNDTAKEIYPNLQKGIKCYKALMGLDSPDRKSTRLNSSHRSQSRMPSSA